MYPFASLFTGEVLTGVVHMARSELTPVYKLALAFVYIPLVELITFFPAHNVLTCP